MACFDFSMGRNRFDAHPEQRTAATLKDFAKQVLSIRAVSKDAAGYVAASFGGDGRRTGANALPRAWLAIDVDGIDVDTLPEWRMHLTRWRGFGWPTASSTPEAPRERVIIELSEPVDRAQGIGIGALILRDVAENFGGAVRIDPCGFRAEQPAFLAPVGVQPFYLLGDALDVPVWLAQAPPAPPPPTPATAEVVALSDARMRWIVGLLGDAGLLRMPLPNNRGFSLICPWQRLHSTDTGASSTALLYPSPENNHAGAFKCLHAHCAGRRLPDLVHLLRRVTKKEQAA